MLKFESFSFCIELCCTISNAEHKKKKRKSASCPSLHALFQCCHGKCLDNGPCWLYLDLLAESNALSSLGCWLVPGLDHADTWNGELALLDLFAGQVGQSLQDLRHFRPLLLACLAQSICNGTLRHGLHSSS